MNPTEMKRYQSPQWNFALDIPKRWNSFPAVPTNSPYEVIRFASRENGTHLLIVFREPHDPKQTLRQQSERVQKLLASKGFGNFVTAETAIKSRPAGILDFEKLHFDTTSPLLLEGDRYVQVSERKWSCRHYFLAEETLAYTLGFGTTSKAGMLELFDRMAKTFEIIPE